MEQQFIIFNAILPQWEEEAQRIREKRDKLYPNIYEEMDTDLRWVGDLGEICFRQLLKKMGISEYEWHQDNAAGKPDFTINKHRIDVKTVKRKVPIQPDYTAQITARHKDHPIDELFFMSYEYKIRKMWLLGGCRLKDFITFARYYDGGEYVHPKYMVRQGHEIYNAEISRLEPPVQWLNRITGVSLL